MALEQESFVRLKVQLKQWHLVEEEAARMRKLFLQVEVKAKGASVAADEWQLRLEVKTSQAQLMQRLWGRMQVEERKSK
jgi:hypothetical protein